MRHEYLQVELRWQTSGDWCPRCGRGAGRSVLVLNENMYTGPDSQRWATERGSSFDVALQEFTAKGWRLVSMLESPDGKVLAILEREAT